MANIYLVSNSSQENQINRRTVSRRMRGNRDGNRNLNPAGHNSFSVSKENILEDKIIKY